MHEFRSLNKDLQRRIKMLLADINTHFIECQMKIQRNTVGQLGRRNALHHKGINQIITAGVSQPREYPVLVFEQNFHNNVLFSCNFN